MGTLIVFVVVLVAAFGVIMGCALLNLEGRDKRDAATRAGLTTQADSVLDGLFDGRPVVTFTASKATLARETLIEGAGMRGYALTSETPRPQSIRDERDLVFTKTQ